MSIDWEAADRKLQRDLYLRMLALGDRIKRGERIWSRHRKANGRDHPRTKEIWEALVALEEEKKQVRRNFFETRAANERRARKKNLQNSVDINQYGF